MQAGLAATQLALAREQQRDVSVAEALQHLVAIAAMRPRTAVHERAAVCARAARILGFVDARFAALGRTRIVTVQQEYDRALAALRDALEADALAKEMAAGASMTEDQAVEEARST